MITTKCHKQSMNKLKWIKQFILAYSWFVCNEYFKQITLFVKNVLTKKIVYLQKSQNKKVARLYTILKTYQNTVR